MGREGKTQGEEEHKRGKRGRSEGRGWNEKKNFWEEQRKRNGSETKNWNRQEQQDTQRREGGGTSEEEKEPTKKTTVVEGGKTGKRVLKEKSDDKGRRGASKGEKGKETQERSCMKRDGTHVRNTGKEHQTGGTGQIDREGGDAVG
ncbi:hypothetical protein Tco_0490138 [Tanacetum coccineum]